jgi:ubiquinone/menaquinone biosynthesis C-methylase UbiE
MITSKTQYDAIFSGVIGKDYELLNLICPIATEMSRLVGLAVNSYSQQSADSLSIIELGGGTGITTLSLLNAQNDVHIVSIDNEPVMQDQAKKHLHAWVDEGKLVFCEDDALTALKKLPTASVDIVATAYTLHNFLNDYREAVINEIYRVLKPGGALVNGDRYALDDVSEHTRLIQHEVSGYFKVLTQINRMDLLEHWIVHLFSDESDNHVMRETVALNELRNAGFIDITLTHRYEVNALITAIKPRIK